MPEQAERKPRKTYVTRESWITKILARYGRTPTANELLAIDNLPCGPYPKLYDRSKIGIYIYHRLCHVEDTGDVSVLEEAGRLLRAQMAGSDPPPPVVRDDRSPTPDLNEAPGYGPPLKHEDASAAPTDAVAHEFDDRELPFRPRTDPYASSQSGAQPAAPPVTAVRAHVIHGDAYFIPVTLRFDSCISASSITINVPSRATADYPRALTADAKSGTEEKPFAPFFDNDSAEIARVNEEMLGGGSVGW